MPSTPPALPLTEQFAPALAQLRQLCEHYRDSGHTKTRALAREFLHDWEAIFAILADPTRPLTNNLAERALRHWVIHRRIPYGTRTKAGTHAFGIIASVVDTCHLRNINPWPFLADSLLARRSQVPLFGGGGGGGLNGYFPWSSVFPVVTPISWVSGAAE
jgi:hypothetical protein